MQQKLSTKSFERETSFAWRDFNCTRLFVVIQGILGGLGGSIHGIYAILQGNKPAWGSSLLTIGAFTVIDNYLITGIAAILVSLALVIWTIGFIHKKNGPTIFLLISILLFLVGGGIAQVGFFLIAWGVSTQINASSSWCQKMFSRDTRTRLAKAWPAFFATGYLFFSIGFGIWLFILPPGTVYTGRPIEFVCWSALVIGLLFQLAAIVTGFARDCERQPKLA
jgi:hypothetical protein